MTIDWSQKMTAQERAASELASKRKVSLTRRAFCLGLATSGILTQADAIQVAKGEWPPTVTSFLTLLTAEQAADAQIEWAATETIERLHPFVLTMGSWLSLTDTEIDALFGIS